MPLHFKHPTRAEIPAELQPFYVERDGAWHLDVEGAVDKSRLEEFRTTNIALPEDAVPPALVRAVCEQAKELLLQDRTTAPAGEGLIATWTDTSGTKYSKSDKRPVLSWVVQSLLAKYSAPVRRGSSLTRLVRT